MNNSPNQQNNNQENKIWKAITGLAIILGMLASITSIASFIRVNRLLNRTEILRNAQHWEFSLDITQPKPNDQIQNYLTNLSGNIIFKDTPEPKKINLLLQEKAIEVIPFVKPVEEIWWYVQAKPIVYEDGSLKGSIILGEESGAGINKEFDIILLVIQKGSITQGERFAKLPENLNASEVIRVKRIQ